MCTLKVKFFGFNCRLLLTGSFSFLGSNRLPRFVIVGIRFPAGYCLTKIDNCPRMIFILYQLSLIFLLHTCPLTRSNTIFKWEKFQQEVEIFMSSFIFKELCVLYWKGTCASFCLIHYYLSRS